MLLYANMKQNVIIMSFGTMNVALAGLLTLAHNLQPHRRLFTSRLEMKHYLFPVFMMIKMAMNMIQQGDLWMITGGREMCIIPTLKLRI